LERRRTRVLGLGDTMTKNQRQETGEKKVSGLLWLDLKLLEAGSSEWSKNGSQLAPDCGDFKNFVKVFAIYL
jgi:hypothetical protein